MTSATMAELPAPLVRPTHHPITFAKQRIALLGTAAVFTYVGILVVAALYYLLLEVWAPATHAWHSLVPHGELRHNIRDVGEGLFGGLLAHMIVWNHYKRSVGKARNWLDRIEIALRIPNVKDGRKLTGISLLLAVPIVLIYAAPGFFGAEWLVHLIKPHVVAPAGASLWNHIAAVVTENYPQKLIGYGAAFFFGRRPAKGIFDHLQEWFAERRIAMGKHLRWYHVPTFKARYNEITATRFVRPRPRSGATIVLRAAVPVGLALAAFGFYVLNYIAH